jgi:hypothetical protein
METTEARSAGNPWDGELFGVLDSNNAPPATTIASIAIVIHNAIIGSIRASASLSRRSRRHRAHREILERFTQSRRFKDLAILAKGKNYPISVDEQ